MHMYTAKGYQHRLLQIQDGKKCQNALSCDLLVQLQSNTNCLRCPAQTAKQVCPSPRIQKSRKILLNQYHEAKLT